MEIFLSEREKVYLLCYVVRRHELNSPFLTEKISFGSKAEGI